MTVIPFKRVRLKAKLSTELGTFMNQAEPYEPTKTLIDEYEAKDRGAIETISRAEMIKPKPNQGRLDQISTEELKANIKRLEEMVGFWDARIPDTLDHHPIGDVIRDLKRELTVYRSHYQARTLVDKP